MIKNSHKIDLYAIQNFIWKKNWPSKGTFSKKMYFSFYEAFEKGTGLRNLYMRTLGVPIWISVTGALLNILSSYTHWIIVEKWTKIGCILGHPIF
jgi:hypothetical protein